MGRDELPLKFLEADVRKEYHHLPHLDPHPPMPQELSSLTPLQAEFWIKMHPNFPSPYFLSTHPLNRIIMLREGELHQLCRYLALFDLYGELKNIVQTKLFKTLKEALSPTELHFLETLRNEPNQVTLPKMHIGAWDHTKESLDKALFDRGKTRLKGALSAGSQVLFAFIPKVFLPTEKKPSKEIAELLLKQVETVLNRAFTYVKHH
ncbi:MAG: hypothetical protein ACOYK9_02760 [Chlamydiia bacterium]